MAKRLGFLLLCFIWLGESLAQPQSTLKRPKIGLALSGGGAKGISHIGVLMVLEKAGIQVDYIVGTSMGSVIGALYAIGYSPDSIAAIARMEDWDYLLASKPELKQISIEEKEDFGRYLLEIPIVSKRLKLPRGVIDGQELSVELSRLTFPVFDRKKFSDFPIPFRCVATDITNGEAVVLDSGNIAEAIRASMAIPSIFTPVKYQNRLLVDGGIVRNFPVEHVKEMGADIVIGVNLSKGFLTENELESILDILNQSIFLSDGDDTRKQREWCDILIEPDLSGYGPGSFNAPDSLIKRGYESAMLQFEKLKQLADELNTKFGPKIPTELPRFDSVLITGFDASEVSKHYRDLTIDRLGLTKNRWYTQNDFPLAIKKVYGTRYFRKVGFEIHGSPQKAKLQIKGIENPPSFLNAALHYNSFSKASVLLNFTSRRLFNQTARFSTTLNIGDVFRLKSDLFKYAGKTKTHGVGATVLYDKYSLPVYENNNQIGLYSHRYLSIDAKYQIASLTVNTLSFGIKKEFFFYTPEVLGGAHTFDGTINHTKTYVSFNLNTLNRHYYAQNGSRVNIDLGYYFNTEPNLISVIKDSINQGFERIPTNPIQLDTLLTRRFVQFKISATRYDAISKRAVMVSGFFAGFTINPFQWKTSANTFLSNFMLGGQLGNFRNQIPFIGLQDMQLRANNFLAYTCTYQYEYVKNIFISPKIGLMVHEANFYKLLTKEPWSSLNTYQMGYGISLGYLSFLGPVDFTIMQHVNSGKIGFYVNLGHNFQ